MSSTVKYCLSISPSADKMYAGELLKKGKMWGGGGMRVKGIGSQNFRLQVFIFFMIQLYAHGHDNPRCHFHQIVLENSPRYLKLVLLASNGLQKVTETLTLTKVSCNQ